MGAESTELKNIYLIDFRKLGRLGLLVHMHQFKDREEGSNGKLKDDVSYKKTSNISNYTFLITIRNHLFIDKFKTRKQNIYIQKNSLGNIVNFIITLINRNSLVGIRSVCQKRFCQKFAKWIQFADDNLPTHDLPKF